MEIALHTEIVDYRSKFSMYSVLVLGGVTEYSYRKGGYPCSDNLATNTHENLESSNRD